MALPDSAVQGALIHQAKQCGSCRVVNGLGMKVAAVQWARQTRGWAIEHFADPPYKFSAKDMENITGYLFTLPE